MLPLAILLASLVTGAHAIAQESVEGELKTFVQPFVRKWCGECHSGKEPEADLNLLKLLARVPSGDGITTVLDIRDALREEDMPPEDEPAPPKSDRARMVAWTDRVLAAARNRADPGRVTMRRLSRFEYRNTIRDLFGITEDVTTEFPAGDLGYGFDNIGDALSVSVLHLEKYAAAARRIAHLAIVTEDPKRPPRRVFEVEDYTLHGRLRAAGDYVVFTSRGHIDLPLDLPRKGEYLVRVRAFGQQAGDQPARMGLSVDGARQSVIDVPNERRKPVTYEKRLLLNGGKRTLSVSFVNDYWNKLHPKKNRRDRNLWVDFVEVVGPVDVRKIPPAQKWIFAADRGRGAAVKRARPILAPVMRKAWRRPVERSEVSRLCRLVRLAVDDGDTFEQGIQLALQAVLVSPYFLYRIEPGGKRRAKGDTKGEQGEKNASEWLGGYEVAARLSYFLWSSMPDDRLMKLAGEKKLHDPEVLADEVRRMLEDDRADALADNFAGQWLELRSIEDAAPDPRRFKSYSRSLRDAMRRETEMFFRAVLRERRPVVDLIDADFTFLNEELAKHYGIDGVRGKKLRRVKLKDPRRGGLITHASILTVTSNPTRTSPVKRGKWILQNILDDPPPPPEPGFDNFKAGADVTVAATLRAQLAEHRKAKGCAVCHNRMDALGLALENYDAIGRWRDADHGTPIDASGKLPGGETLDGPVSLKKVLRRGDAFTNCLAKKLFLYAIGREIRATEAVVIDALVGSLPKRATLEDMIVAVAELDAFRRRRLDD